MMTPQAHLLAHICAEHDVDVLWAFGSRAAQISLWLAGTRPSLGARHAEADGGAKADAGLRPSATRPGLVEQQADADIGVKMAAQCTPSVADKVRLARALEELFRLPRVDLVFLAEADPFLAANVIRGELLYAGDDHSAAEYELDVLRRAGDLAPLERERLDLIFGRSE